MRTKIKKVCELEAVHYFLINFTYAKSEATFLSFYFLTSYAYLGSGNLCDFHEFFAV